MKMRQPKEIAKLLVKMEEEKGITFNEMPLEELMKWVEFLRMEKD